MIEGRFSGGRWRNQLVLWGAVLLPLTSALPIPAHAYPRPGTLDKITVRPDGSPASFSGLQLTNCKLVRTTDACTVSISTNGRYVTFSSPANNLVPGDENKAPDVFIRDLRTKHTELVSVGLRGGSATVVPQATGAGGSFQPDVSADGRYVVFTSNAIDLTTDKKLPTSFSIFVRDRKRGSTERISLGQNGVDPLGDATAPVISDDGRYVVYDSDAANVVSGDTNLVVDVFAYDRQTKQTRRISVSSAGVQGDKMSDRPSISADGRYAAFTSYATNLVAAGSDGNSVYVHDLRTHRTEVAAVHTGDQKPSTGISGPHAISSDGRYVTYYSSDNSVVPRDSGTLGSDIDAFVHDRKTGQTERISVQSSGAELNRDGAPGTASEAAYPTISGNGRFVSFYQTTTGYPLASDEGYVWLHDRYTGASERVSLHDHLMPAKPCDDDDQDATLGPPGMVMSGDGRYMVFTSCEVLTSGDTNNQVDVFVRDRGVPSGVNMVKSSTKLSVANSQPANASLVSRSETRDVYLRIEAPSISDFRLTSPGTVHGLEMTVRGQRYQVRAAKTGLDADFGLFRLDPLTGWTLQQTLEGGYGTVSSAITVALPLRAVGAASAHDLGDVAAFTAKGTFLSGPI